jgi:hypothetical protein
MKDVKFKTRNPKTIAVLIDLAKAHLPNRKYEPLSGDIAGFCLFSTNQEKYFGPFRVGSSVDRDAEELSLETMINLITGGEISVKLNDTYTAVVSKDGITVGCQTFPLDVAKKVFEAAASFGNR